MENDSGFKKEVRNRGDRMAALGGGYEGLVLAMVWSAVGGLATLRNRGVWKDSPDELETTVLPKDGKQFTQITRRMQSTELIFWRDGADSLLNIVNEHFDMDWTKDTLRSMAIRACDDNHAQITVGAIGY